MDLSIQQILRQHKVKGVFHTHVSMGQTKGKYQFNRQDLEEFWKIYMKTIHENPDTCAGIAPDTFRLVDSQEYAYVFMQPKDPVQHKKAHKALALCPVDSIGYDV